MGEGRGGEEGRDESEENERTTMMKGVESGRSGLDAASPPPSPNFDGRYDKRRRRDATRSPSRCPPPRLPLGDSSFA